METGRSSSVYSAYSSVRSIPRTSPSELTISVTTRPQPPCRLTRRRKAVSVMPAIGAMPSGGASAMEPIFMSVWLHVRRVHLDADGLSNEIDREHEPRMRPLANQAPEHPLQRPVHHLDHRALLNEGARVVLQLARDQPADPVDLDVGDRRDVAVHRDDAHHARALEHGEPLSGIEAGEAVARKERPVDFLAPVLPAAPAGDGREKRLEAVVLDLLAHDLFVPRTRPDSEPRGDAHQSRGLTRRSGEPARPAARTPSAARRSSTR